MIKPKTGRCTQANIATSAKKSCFFSYFVPVTSFLLQQTAQYLQGAVFLGVGDMFGEMTLSWPKWTRFIAWSPVFRVRGIERFDYHFN